MTTYYVRADGSATKANATSSSAAASSMSLATFNGETFSAGDVVVFSSRGGNLASAAIILPSAGESGNIISYEGEAGYTPNVTAPVSAAIVCAKSHVAIKNITTNACSYGLHFPAGTHVGVTTENLHIVNPTAEGVRHEGTATVTHTGLEVSGVSEPLTTHAGGTIALINSSINGYGNGGAVRGAPGSTASWVFTGCLFEAAAGGLFISNTNISSGTITLTDCVIKDRGATRGWDIRGAGVLTMKNCIVIGATNGDFYILPKDGSKIYNCTFIGNGYDPSNSLIFNNGLTGFVAKNCIFKDVYNTAYATSGTWDYNLFYNAGTARGTNTVTTDPGLSATGRISAGSSAINAGVGPATDAVVPTTDIDGDARSGVTCDIGADELTEVTPTFQAAWARNRNILIGSGVA